jgi:hypothetical protein
MVGVTKALKNNRLISTSVISDIRVYICGNNKICIFIVDISPGDRISIFFLECIIFGDGTDVLSRNLGNQLPAELLNNPEERRHHLV